MFDERSERLLAERLGPTCAGLPHTLVEVKPRRALPAWIDEITDPLALTFVSKHPLSEFVAASLAVHGSHPLDRQALP